MISKNTWLLIRFLFKDSSRFLLKAISVKEYMIVWWTRKVRRSSGKRLIKNNQQCAHYGHHAVVCLLSGWHLEMAGRDWFLGVPFFSDQFITQTPSPHGEGKRTEQESSFLEEREQEVLQITLNGGVKCQKNKTIYKTDSWKVLLRL